MGDYMITLTETASARVQEILQEPDNVGKILRVFVQGGGCAGFEYGFALEDTKNEDDFDVPTTTGTPVVVDAMSLQYLQGAKVDYIEDLVGSRFAIDNPGAQTTCGCGSSFSYDMDNFDFNSHAFD